jgi:glycosyltransferase involved in cell wall biosynthesis
MASLKALFFTNALGGGGAENHAMRLLNHLDRRRVTPILALGRRSGSYEAFLRQDVPIFQVAPRFVPSSLGQAIAAIPFLRALVRRERPDVVVSIMDRPALGALMALSKVPNRPKLVVSIQIPPTFEFGRTTWGRRVMLPAIRALYTRADRIISLSRGVASDLTSVQPKLANMIGVIPNACVEDRLLMLPAGNGIAAPAAPLILAAGRLVYQKGYPVLIEAFAQLRKRVEAELWILGTGPDRRRLEALIRVHALERNVKLIGFQPNPQDYMRMATVFVLSSHYEGFGNVIVEALACGTPVVSTDCSFGPGEILKDEQGGLLVPVADPEALASALERVITDQSLRQRLAAAGQRRAQDFSAAAVANAYADELERICHS